MSYSETSLARLTSPTSIGLASGKPRQEVSSTYQYATDDAAATVEAAGYFNSARSRLVKGDVIIARMAMAGTPIVKVYIATAVPSTGNVTIALAATAAG